MSDYLVRDVEYNTPLRRKKPVKEINDGETVVDMAGYIPAKAQIESLIMAGQRLVDHRRQLYDFAPDQQVDEDFIDPTRSRGFDMADASTMADDVNARLKESAKEAKKEKEKPAEKPAEKEEETE